MDPMTGPVANDVKSMGSGASGVEAPEQGMVHSA